MRLDVVLKNGLLVDPKHNVNEQFDVGIHEGKVIMVEKEIGEGESVIDLQGKLLIPGVIDMHTHVTRYLGGEVGYRMIAETGVTTTIDFAGPVQDILDDLHTWGSGLNVGSIEAIIPGRRQIEHSNPSPSKVEDFLCKALENGSLGLKLFGGHAPLTPEATEEGMRIANNLQVMVAFHAGTTATASDMSGMREAIELASGKKLLLAHINAYCRGRESHPLDELKEALTLLCENRNIYSDSHLAVMNGTKGNCKDGVPTDYVTQVCLDRNGYPLTESGLEQAILNGIARVIKNGSAANELLSGKEALLYWKEKETNAFISFPVNLPTTAVACAVERVKPAGDFVIGLTSTDGGGIPRNNLVKRILSLYQLGYLSLEDIVTKISLNPAKMFGLVNKGHLGVGADADITVIDIDKSEAVMSFVGGNMNMKDGIVLGKGGRLLVTDAGIKSAKRAELDYQVVDIKKSTLYQS
ncbi:amidohydrolase family protein [Pseudalkalibacillus decolorationis]|uniref:amidohydrolase family protein n=1 Tax=Pseudalkalibacillus decolorationis TaxID=163879 RepID=UPI002148BC8D|nr:amidohydrolase family protein [Pseudalkalibacillus decolorationis]